jgi:hypothetical protein
VSTNPGRIVVAVVCVAAILVTAGVLVYLHEQASPGASRSTPGTPTHGPPVTIANASGFSTEYGSGLGSSRLAVACVGCPIVGDPGSSLVVRLSLTWSPTVPRANLTSVSVALPFNSSGTPRALPIGFPSNGPLMWNVSVRAPSTPGTYALGGTLGVEANTSRSAPTNVTITDVSGLTTVYGAGVPSDLSAPVCSNCPVTAVPGHDASVEVEVRWTSSETNVSLVAATVKNPFSAPSEVPPFPLSLVPNGSTEFTLVVLAPSVAGSYSLAGVLYLNATGSGGKLPIGTALAVGSPIDSQGSNNSTTPCPATEYCVEFQVEAASNISPIDVGLNVTTSTGGPFSISGTGGATIVNLSFAVVVQATVPAGLFTVSNWTAGAGFSVHTPLNSTMELWLNMGATNPMGQGLVLVLVGESAYTGMVSVAIP